MSEVKPQGSGLIGGGVSPAKPVEKPYISPSHTTPSEEKKPEVKTEAKPSDHYEGKVEYPKWVHGELANDVDAEAAILKKLAAPTSKATKPE